MSSRTSLDEYVVIQVRLRCFGVLKRAEDLDYTSLGDLFGKPIAVTRISISLGRVTIKEYLTGASLLVAFKYS